jgi:hypothetical protein
MLLKGEPFDRSCGFSGNNWSFHRGLITYRLGFGAGPVAVDKLLGGQEGANRKRDEGPVRRQAPESIAYASTRGGDG